LIDWKLNDAINKGVEWNVLEVNAEGNQLSFTINGSIVWQGTDSSHSSGRVGFGMYIKPGGVNDVLRVDWATLTPIQGSATGYQEPIIEVINPQGGVGARSDLEVTLPKGIDP
jgi:hypothetical protein